MNQWSRENKILRIIKYNLHIHNSTTPVLQKQYNSKQQQKVQPAGSLLSSILFIIN